MAANGGHTEILKMLLGPGGIAFRAPLNGKVVTLNGETALQWAEEAKHAEIVEMLKNHKS